MPTIRVELRLPTQARLPTRVRPLHAQVRKTRPMHRWQCGWPSWFRPLANHRKIVYPHSSAEFVIEMLTRQSTNKDLNEIGLRSRCEIELFESPRLAACFTKSEKIQVSAIPNIADLKAHAA